MKGQSWRGTVLPHAPLLMLHPLAIPGPTIPGKDIISELLLVPGAATAYELHWKVLCWSYHPTRPPGDAPTWKEVEAELLSRPDELLSQLCAQLAGLFARPKSLHKEDVARACLEISDWALKRGHGRTGADFAKVAALAWPQNPRYACIAGGILCFLGEAVQAEWWFRRAHRLAVWSRDNEAKVRALIGWAEAGAIRVGPEYAIRVYRRAILVAEAYKLAEWREEAIADLEQLQRKGKPSTQSLLARRQCDARGHRGGNRMLPDRAEGGRAPQQSASARP